MEEIIVAPIKEEVEQGFIDYSMSVITDRALPSAEDGLKPVLRRILYTMHENGMQNSKKFFKCAVPVADTMGRYHPHGDSSIYQTLVGAAQPWNMRYPLVSFHGNAGSRDGDGPAHYRYTECKLSKIAEATLDGIDRGVCDWAPNYTEDNQEPVYLPGIFPNLLCNGGSGIAVAIACSFAPHNLTEVINGAVHLLENPEATVDDLMVHIPGPDFPTGGLVVNKDELRNVYATGRGSARMRAEYHIEDEDTLKIVYTSIPYKISKEQLLIKIDEVCESGRIDGITTIRDESTMQGVRFVVELARGASPQVIVDKLYRYTPLETTYSYNQVALVKKKPVQVNLKQILAIYLDHQKQALERVSTYEKNKIEAKLHVIQGMIIALADIDNIIKIIRNSETALAAKVWLMTNLQLSEIQAKAILDMRLSKLAQLEGVALQDEANTLSESMKYYAKILEDKTFADSELKTLMLRLSAAFGDERRTVITQARAIPKEEEEVKYVEPEKCVVILTEAGNIKRVPSASYKNSNRNTKGARSQDEVSTMVLRTNTQDQLMIFTSNGTMYRLLVDKIPSGTNASRGVGIGTLVSLGAGETVETIYSIYRETTAKYVLFATKKGMVKKTSIKEYLDTKKRGGLAAIKLKEGDSLAAVTLVDNEDLLFVTRDGKVLRTTGASIGASGRATMGVKGIGLVKEDELVTVLPIRDPNDCLALFTSTGMGAKAPSSEYMVQARGGKGVIGCKGTVGAAALISDEDSILVSGPVASLCVSGADVPTAKRGAVGVRILKDSPICAVTKM